MEQILVSAEIAHVPSCIQTRQSRVWSASMKGNRFANILLALTAFAPAVLIYSVVWFTKCKLVGGFICLPDFVRL